eukprot:CAMPEP_0170546292 /NCGR_PEP_ID=MMETSP0211-20121228/4664_1 /TAXON_ID=311385 /ORGANISM="Pseudokeronopsis sp., Strain OXSARD2" /LENGTH=84 /DNA_ID=CAMNT_0010850687 /DNA_START=1008 /DNA_END=1262 /DNA_ORIENTATION=+
MDLSGELCIATSNGLFFGSHDESYAFVENKEESYFNGCKVKSFFEHEFGKFVCAICDDPSKSYVQLFDRRTGEITLKVKNPAGN